MKKLFNVIVLALAINFLAAAGGVAWLFRSGHLDRARLLEVIFRWWSDVLRASTGLNGKEIPSAAKQTREVAKRLTTNECLKRIRRVEET